jgi:hypothetical protein
MPLTRPGPSVACLKDRGSGHGPSKEAAGNEIRQTPVSDQKILGQGEVRRWARLLTRKRATLRNRRGARVAIAVCALFLCLADVGISDAISAGSSQARAAGVAPTNSQPPSIAGTAKPGETLMASPGAWAGEPTTYTYKWQVCYPAGCLVRQESTAPTYVVSPKDAFHALSVTVTATNEAGSATATSATVNVEPSWHYSTGSPRRETISWGTQRPLPWSTARALAIGVGTGMCVGEKPFRFDEIEVHERAPSSQLPFPSAVITTSIVWPAPREIVGTVNPEEGQPACAGIGIGADRTIKLKRPAAQLYVYDGSQTPPRLVLQPAKILPWKLRRKVGPKTIEIAVPFAACAGLWIKTHVVERLGRAIITAYGQEPEHRNPGRCLRVRGVEELKVRLHAYVGDVEIFDGSTDSPEPRLPPGPKW